MQLASTHSPTHHLKLSSRLRLQNGCQLDSSSKKTITLPNFLFKFTKIDRMSSMTYMKDSQKAISLYFFKIQVFMNSNNFEISFKGPMLSLISRSALILVSSESWIFIMKTELLEMLGFIVCSSLCKLLSTQQYR